MRNIRGELGPSLKVFVECATMLMLGRHGGLAFLSVAFLSFQVDATHDRGSPMKSWLIATHSKEEKWTRAQRINRERSFSRLPESLQMGSGVRGSLDVPTCGPRFVRFALHLPGPDGRD